MNFKIFFLLVILAGSIVWAVYEYNHPPVEQSPYYKDGINAFNLGMFTEAEEYFNMAIHENDRDALSFFYRGLSRLKQEDYTGAVEDCKTAIELDPDLENLYYNYGLDYYEMYGNDSTDPVPEADSDIIDPGLTDVNEINLQGLTAFYSEDYRKAIRLFERALEIDPEFTAAMYNLGLCHYALGEKEVAIEWYSKTIALDSKYADAYFERAYVKYELEDYEGSVKDYSKSIELDPEEASAFRNRGLCKYQLDDMEGACSDWHKAEDLGADLSDLIPVYCE
ncbi:MAG: tetratricopeptide repeat protein [Bacteroidota bacterium]